MAERLARIHIGDMHLNAGCVDAAHRVAQGIGIVRVGTRVVDDTVVGRMRLVNLVDEAALVVRLIALYGNALGSTVIDHKFFEVNKRIAAIYRRLANTQHIQVRPIHQKNLHALLPFVLFLKRKTTLPPVRSIPCVAS